MFNSLKIFQGLGLSDVIHQGQKSSLSMAPLRSIWIMLWAQRTYHYFLDVKCEGVMIPTCSHDVPQDKQINFWRWVSESFPPDTRV